MIVATSKIFDDNAPGSLSYLLNDYCGFSPSCPYAQALRAADIDSVYIFLNTPVEELYLIHRSAPHLQLLEIDLSIFHELQNWLLHLNSLHYPILDPEFWNNAKISSKHFHSFTKTNFTVSVPPFPDLYMVDSKEEQQCLTNDDMYPLVIGTNHILASRPTLLTISLMLGTCPTRHFCF